MNPLSSLSSLVKFVGIRKKAQRPKLPLRLMADATGMEIFAVLFFLMLWYFPLWAAYGPQPKNIAAYFEISLSSELAKGAGSFLFCLPWVALFSWNKRESLAGFAITVLGLLIALLLFTLIGRDLLVSEKQEPAKIAKVFIGGHRLYIPTRYMPLLGAPPYLPRNQKPFSYNRGSNRGFYHERLYHQKEHEKPVFVETVIFRKTGLFTFKKRYSALRGVSYFQLSYNKDPNLGKKNTQEFLENPAKVKEGNVWRLKQTFVSVRPNASGDHFVADCYQIHHVHCRFRGTIMNGTIAFRAEITKKKISKNSAWVKKFYPAESWPVLIKDIERFFKDMKDPNNT